MVVSPLRARCTNAGWVRFAALRSGLHERRVVAGDLCQLLFLPLDLLLPILAVARGCGTFSLNRSMPDFGGFVVQYRCKSSQEAWSLSRALLGLAGVAVVALATAAGRPLGPRSLVHRFPQPGA